MRFDRQWAMPSKHTFTIKPIQELLGQEMVGDVWADPFSGWNSPAMHTNDLNPNAPTTHHLEAGEFAALMPDGLDGVLFDPPYSPAQISRSYKGFGRKVTMQDTQNGALYARVKDLLAPRIKPNGVAICFGWNSGGFGIKRGFQLDRVLIVPHGGAHNDTIITVERKIQGQLI